jgi:tetratricopeptide (TPR) repeat protein
MRVRAREARLCQFQICTEAALIPPNSKRVNGGYGTGLGDAAAQVYGRAGFPNNRAPRRERPEQERISMKSSMTAIGLALAIAVSATPAAGQYTGPTAPRPETNVPPATEQQPEQQGAISPSRGAQKAIVALKEAVDANDVANIPARVAAAEAVARTAEDRYLIAALRYKAASAAKDQVGVASAIEALLASGKISPSDLNPLTLELAVAQYNLKQFDKAGATFERLLAASPNDTNAMVMLAEVRQSQGRTSDAVELFRRAIAQTKASGAKAKEEWHRRAIAIAYNAKSPAAIALSRDWVAAYPTTANWKDALRIYRNSVNADESLVLDTLRLARATGTLAGDADFHRNAYLTITRGYPGEAKAVIDEAIAAKAIDPTKQLFKDIIAEANEKSAGERANLAQAMSAALAAPDAKRAVTAGDLHYGYGEFTKAAELYRAALGKSGADKDLINLRLGMALARAGDKAGATAALNAVGGPRAELAKYWLVYVNTRA